MKLLRHVKTMEYFAHGNWTPDPSMAQDFPDIRSATAACMEYQLTDVELVTQLDFERSEFDETRLPVSNQ